MFVRVRLYDLKTRRAGFASLVTALTCACAANVLMFRAANAQYAGVGQVPSVVMLDPADRSVDPYTAVFAAVDGNGVPSTASYLRTLLGGKRLSVPQTTGALGDTTTRKGSMNFIMVAELDPHWDRWQKDAQEKLKDEVSVRMPKQHPLALANPEKSVVVCEAGCRSTKDEIVYMAAAVPAVSPADAGQGQYQTTASDAPAQHQLEEGELPCIAGCYERPQRNKPAPSRKADATPAVRPAVQPAVQPAAGQRLATASAPNASNAQRDVPRLLPSAATVTTVVAPPPAQAAPATIRVSQFAIRQILRVVVRAYVPTASPAHHAAVQPHALRPIQQAVNGAIVETRRVSTNRRKADGVHAARVKQKSRTLGSLKIARGWTAKVTFARRDEPEKLQPVAPVRSHAVMKTRVLSRMTEAARLRRVSKSAWRVRVVEF